MDPDTKVELDCLVSQHKTWEPTSMLFTIDDVVCNLLEFIGKNCTKPKGSAFYFPTEYDSISKRVGDKLAWELRHAASQAGFSLAVKGWDRGECRIVFRCQRGFVFKSQQRSTPQKETSTIRPQSKESQCPFFFAVKWDEKKMLYELIAGHGDRRHRHHLPKEPYEVRRGVGYQHDEQKKLNIRLYGSGASSQLVRNYNLERSGDLIADGTLDYLRRLAFNRDNGVAAVALGYNNEVKHSGQALSEAEKLLLYLKSIPDISYIALYSEQKSDLMTVSKRDFKAIQKRQHLRSVSRVAGQIAEEEGEVSSFPEFEDSLDFETFASVTRKAMSIPEEDKMLLMIAWTTNNSCRKFRQYSQSTSSDTVEKLNNVQRCLYMFALTTANRKNIPVMWTYLPAQAQWAFKWAQTRALTTLFPFSALQMMHLHITDGDRKIYNFFCMAIEDGIFPNCIHRLCGFHFRGRGELSKIVTGNLGPKGQVYFCIIKKWIRTWHCYIETLAEYKESRKLFDNWLDSDEVTDKDSLTHQVAVQVRKILLTSFDPNLRKFLRCYFMNVFGYNKEASQSSETENSVLKRGPAKPNQSIVRSTEGIVRNNQSREKKNSQKAAVTVDRQRLAVECDQNWKILLNELVDNAYKICEEQVAKMERLVVWHCGISRFYVKVSTYKDYSNRKYSDSDFKFYKVPYFERTRVVTVETDIRGRSYLKCTCCLFEQQRCPCAEQLKVLGRMPTVQDCSLIHTKTYEHCYLRPGYDDVTSKMTEVLKSELHGPLFGEDSHKKWVVGKGEVAEIPLSYFERSLPSCQPLVKKGNFWCHQGLVHLAQPEEDIEKQNFDFETPHGQGVFLQEEACLSQNAASIHSQQQFVDIAGLQRDNGSLMLDPEDYNPICPEHNSDMDTPEHTLEKDNIQRRKERKQIFVRFSPYFNLICKTGEKSFRACCEIERVLPRLMKTCLQLSREDEENRAGGHIDTSMGVANDQAQSNRRIKPFHSPARRKVKRRRGKDQYSPDQNWDETLSL